MNIKKSYSTNNCRIHIGALEPKKHRERGFWYGLLNGVAAGLITAILLRLCACPGSADREYFILDKPRLGTTLVLGKQYVFEFKHAHKTRMDRRWLLFKTADRQWYYSATITCSAFNTLTVYVPSEMQIGFGSAEIFTCEAEARLADHLARADQGDAVPKELVADGLYSGECEQEVLGSYNFLQRVRSPEDTTLATPTARPVPTQTPVISEPVSTHYNNPAGRRSLRNRDLIQGETAGPIARTWLALECQRKFYPIEKLNSVGRWSHYIPITPQLIGRRATIVIIAVSSEDDRRLLLVNRETTNGVILVDRFTYVQRDADVALLRE